MKIVVGHLYPDHLNIYADRGNIAVLARRAGWRGIDLEVCGIGPGQAVDPAAYDLLYIGGGQDREQALIAPDLAGHAEDIEEALAGERRFSLSAGATSSWAGRISTARARSFRAPVSSTCRPLPESAG